jgi:hypothetical protein
VTASREGRQADFLCGLAAGFFAPGSFDFLPWIGISISAMRIALRRLLDQQRQTVEALAKASCALTKSSFSMYL